MPNQYNKYEIFQLYELHDGEWLPMGEYNAVLVEENSEDCGYVPTPTDYKWEFINDVCGYDVPEGSEVLEPIFSSTTETYNDCFEYDLGLVTETHYLSGYSEDTMVEYSSKTEVDIIEENSEDCGYVPPEPISENNYIVFDNDTYFKTTYQPTSTNMSFEIKVETPPSIGSTSYTAFGSRHSWGTSTEQYTYQFTIGNDSSKGNTYRLGSCSDGYGRYWTAKPTVSSIYYFKASSTLITEQKEGENIVEYHPNISFSGCKYPIWIGWLNSGGSGTDNKYIGKIYYLKFYEDGVLTHHYVPAYNNDEYCLYDVVTDEYIYSSGSSTVQGYVE